MNKKFNFLDQYSLTEDLEEIKATLTYLPYMICFYPKPPYEICEHVLMINPDNIQHIHLKDNPDYDKIVELYTFLTL